MSDCSDIRDKMLELLYDELSVSERPQVEKHIAGCDSCKTEFAELQGVRQAYGALPDVAPPARVSAYVLAEAAKAAKSPKGIFGWLFSGVQSVGAHPGLAAAASLVLVVTVAGAMYWKNGTSMIAQPGATPAMERADANIPEAVSKDAPLEPKKVAPAEAFGDDKELDKVAVAKVSREEIAKKGRPVGLASKKQDRSLLKKQAEASMKQRVRKTKAKLARSLDGLERERAPGAAKPAVSKSAPSDRYREQVRQDGVMKNVLSEAEAVPQKKRSRKGTGYDEDAGLADEYGAEGLDESFAVEEKQKQEVSKPSSVTLKLHSQLRMALKKGNCKTALELGSRIRKEDVEYFNRAVSKDDAFSKCVVQSRAQEKKTGSSKKASKKKL